VAVVIDAIPGGESFVQLGHGGHLRHRHQVTPAEPTHLSLDSALFVSAPDAGGTKEAVVAIVAAQGHEALVLGAVPPDQDLDHGGF